jgi:phage-related protein
MMMTGSQLRKPLFWIGSSKSDLKKFPRDVMRVMGQALDDAQCGGKHSDAKPFKGFKGGGVLEIVDDHQGDTYRALYTVKFAGVVYSLHAFQKKARRGIKTPQKEVDLIKARYEDAKAHYGRLMAAKKKGK